MRRPVASRCSHVIEIERRKRFCNSQTGLEERVFRLPLSLSFARRVRIDQASLGKAFVAIVLSIQKREDNKILTHFIHKINTQGYIKLVNKLNHIFKKMAQSITSSHLNEIPPLFIHEEIEKAMTSLKLQYSCANKCDFFAKKNRIIRSLLYSGADGEFLDRGGLKV